MLDLQWTRVDEDSRVAITLMARMSQRRGISPWLTGLKVPARGAVRTGWVAAYRVCPTVNAALDEAASISRQRRH